MFGFGAKFNAKADLKFILHLLLLCPSQKRFLRMASFKSQHGIVYAFWTDAVYSQAVSTWIIVNKIRKVKANVTCVELWTRHYQ